MAPNSVTGSFRGIEVSFNFNGPHIVMSVVNKEDEGRKLRVMFQQQPHSGRVNWTSFQLTNYPQDVVVPSDVIQSHKLAFYVDNHEPIATFTEKILEELKLIKARQPSDENLPSTEEPSLPNDVTNADLDNFDINKENGLYEQNLEDNNKLQPLPLDKPKDDLPELDETENDDTDNTISSVDTNLTQADNGSADINNGGPELNTNNGNMLNETSSKETPADQSIQKYNSHGDFPEKASKRKTQYIGHYIPSISDEIQFKIKVPSIPRSAEKPQATYIPPQPNSDSKLKNKSYRFFGNLASAFGITGPKKKEYFIQKNKTLYDRFHSNLERLESNYNNGCGTNLDNWDLESLTEQQTAVLLLNLMVTEIGAWKKMAKKNNSTKDTLAKSLETIEKEIKLTLKQTRRGQAPSPTLFPDRSASNEKELMDIQKDCDTYLRRFSEKLVAFDQKHAEKVKIPAFKKYLVEFIRDKLFPNVAEYCSLTSDQKQLNWFLDLIDYELMPIEIGKTKFSPDHHEIIEKRSGDHEPETIIEVVTPGLQSKDGKRVIQNAVVIQAE